jgi:hypothetical protein
LKLHFKTFLIHGQTAHRDEVIKQIITSFESAFSALPKELKFQVDIAGKYVELYNDRIITSISFQIPEVKIGPCCGFSRTYRALCDYYRVHNSNPEMQQNIRWTVDHCMEGANDHIFDFKTFSK